MASPKKTDPKGKSKQPGAAKRGASRPADHVYSTLKIEVAGRIATITLNRPERLNAINDRHAGRDPPGGRGRQCR